MCPKIVLGVSDRAKDVQISLFTSLGENQGVGRIMFPLKLVGNSSLPFQASGVLLLIFGVPWCVDRHITLVRFHHHIVFSLGVSSHGYSLTRTSVMLD